MALEYVKLQTPRRSSHSLIVKERKNKLVNILSSRAQPRRHPQYLHSMLTRVIFYNRVSHILIAPATFRADQEKRQSCGYSSLKRYIKSTPQTSLKSLMNI